MGKCQWRIKLEMSVEYKVEDISKEDKVENVSGG